MHGERHVRASTRAGRKKEMKPVPPSLGITALVTGSSNHLPPTLSPKRHHWIA